VVGRSGRLIASSPQRRRQIVASTVQTGRDGAQRVDLALEGLSRRVTPIDSAGILLRRAPCFVRSFRASMAMLPTSKASHTPQLRASSVDLGELVRECLAHVRPALPPSCACKTRVQGGLLFHVEPTAIVTAISVLLNAVSLRLTARTDPASCPRLSLRVMARDGRTILTLLYNAPRPASREASAHETRAFKLLESLGGAASTRSTRRWSILHVQFPADRGEASTVGKAISSR
jgi:hypothetical protein